MQWRNTCHKKMSESVGVVLSVASRHPAARSSSGSNSEWPQLHQRLPVELPPLPLPEAPTLGKVPVYSVVRNPPTVELYRIVVVVVIDPASDLLIQVDVFIPPRGRLVLRGHLVSYLPVVPILEPERSGVEGPHGAVPTRQLSGKIFLTGGQFGGDWR